MPALDRTTAATETPSPAITPVRPQHRPARRTAQAVAFGVLLLVAAALVSCTRTVYIVQQPDGTLREVAAPPTEVSEAEGTTNETTTTSISGRDGNEGTATTVVETGGDDVVIIDVLPSNEYVLVEETVDAAEPLFLQVTVAAAEDIAIDRAPMNVAIVLDRSGSMGGQKIQDARQAAGWLVDHLVDGDTVSIVSYSSDVTVDVPPTTLDEGSRNDLHRAIQRIEAGANTFLSGGLETGAGQIREVLDPERLNRVVLLSDGLANEGVTSLYDLRAMADRFREEGITITTMGVGYDYNEDLMTTVAMAGGGNYYFIESSRALASVFQQELDSFGRTVVRDATLHLDLPHGVTVREVYGYAFDQSGRSLEVAMNGVSAGERKRLLLALDVPRDATGALTVASGRLEYRNELSRADESVEVAPIVVERTRDRTRVADGHNVRVVEKVEAVKNAVAREEAMRALDRGDRQAAQAIVQKRVQENKMSVINFESDEIEGELRSLEDFADEVEAAPERGSQGYKKMRKSRMKESYDLMVQ